MTDFADAPVSLGERRALGGDDCDQWTPREMLVHLLREIDSGHFKPDGLMLCFFRNHDSAVLTGMRRSRMTQMEAVAMIEMAKHDLLNS